MPPCLDVPKHPLHVKQRTYSRDKQAAMRNLICTREEHDFMDRVQRTKNDQEIKLI